MLVSKGYGTSNAPPCLGPFSFSRPEPEPSDMAIEILYCGVCHTVLHQVRNEWGPMIAAGL
jgi:uncharacterized zinc-type alcohol dehydrogenase-like protein